MIVIFSFSQDYSTYEIIKWLNYMGEYNIVRINSDEKHALKLRIHENDFSIFIDNQCIELNDIRAVWYRKGQHWFHSQFDTVNIEEHSILSEYLNNKAETEEFKFSEYIHYLIWCSVPVLGSAKKSDLNKFITLSIAKSVGLLIPDFHVINEREMAERLLDQELSWITKSMSDGVYLFENRNANQGYFSYTETLSEKHLSGMPEVISPSLIQKHIDKRYEVRVFFLEDTCYSMAIFSQSDTKTRTDYRKYNDEKPNRVVPYHLPQDIDDKIKKLFGKLELNTGSVDLMVDTAGDYYFLEVNPVGQFGVHSLVCNYHLEKKVAEWLLRHEKRVN